jgi:hypothetical protein
MHDAKGAVASVCSCAELHHKSDRRIRPSKVSSSMPLATAGQAAVQSRLQHDLIKGVPSRHSGIPAREASSFFLRERVADALETPTKYWINQPASGD